MDDVPLQLDALRIGLLGHFDTVEVAPDLETEELRQRLTGFLQTYGNDDNARLFIYYAGHGYTEVIRERNENRGYITGIDTPWINGTPQAYNAARIKAISMGSIRAPLEDARAKSILFVFDSCFAGTVFTDRAGDEPLPLTKGKVAQLMENQARDFITAGKSDQRVPAHSPIPELLLAALNGAADRYRWGVISAADIRAYMLDQIRNLDLTPQEGKLNNPAFAEGAFLFRVINPAIRAPDENETIRLYRADADEGDAHAQAILGYLYSYGLGGLPKDDREAARLFKLAADRGDETGQVNLGIFYSEGNSGLPK
ncbi:MAG: tetratricopeptide repeat protein, partial [Methylocella sp.]